MKEIRVKKVDNGYILYKKAFLEWDTYVTNNYKYLLEEISKYFQEG